MNFIRYQKLNFNKSSIEIIELANKIIEEYLAEGYDLTLRQLYYQFVARNIFPEDRRYSLINGKWKKDLNGTKNAEPNYKWLGKLMNDGRLAGLIDWDAIVDRTRNLEKNSHWNNPAEIISACAEQYRIDTMGTQDIYIEVWVEKDALSGVLERICPELDISYMSCRGYISQSAIWRASLRFLQQEKKRNVLLIYLGDHDPSGLDMTRDISDRLQTFACCRTYVERIALTMEQIEEYNPPPNPAKITDSRYQSYVAEYGEESWELDALDPRIITELISKIVGENTNQAARYKLMKKQNADRKKLRMIAEGLKK